jgi:hypothetical protein
MYTCWRSQTKLGAKREVWKSDLQQEVVHITPNDRILTDFFTLGYLHNLRAQSSDAIVSGSKQVAGFISHSFYLFLEQEKLRLEPFLSFQL